jgi:FixJ family two-component response regulator
MIDRDSRVVAIVDDDYRMRDALEGLLKAEGFATRAFASAEEFLASGQPRECACLITDIQMPGMSGLDLQARLNAEQIKLPIIFITAHGNSQMRMQALRSGAVEFLAKPFDDEVLLDTVRAGLAY